MALFAYDTKSSRKDIEISRACAIINKKFVSLHLSLLSSQREEAMLTQ